jgi:hypothetical protein
MPPSITELSDAALSLPIDAKVELTDKLIASLVADVPAEIREAQIAEVMRRREEVLSGRVKLIPGDVVMRDIRRMLDERPRVSS